MCQPLHSCQADRGIHQPGSLSANVFGGWSWCCPCYCPLVERVGGGVLQSQSQQHIKSVPSAYIQPECSIPCSLMLSSSLLLSSLSPVSIKTGVDACWRPVKMIKIENLHCGCCCCIFAIVVVVVRSKCSFPWCLLGPFVVVVSCVLPDVWRQSIPLFLFLLLSSRV